MTPELVGSLIDRFGLPVAILVSFGFLILSGRLRTGSEVEYRERLRAEEREARLAAENRLAEAVAANRELTDGFRELERTVLRDQLRDSSGPTGRKG